MTFIKSAASITLATAVALTTANVGIVFANETTDSAVKITDLNVQFNGNGSVAVDFTIDKDINLREFKDNIEIKVKAPNGFTKTKGKTWDGYLNGVDGTKYGIKNPNVPAGKYSTVFTYNELIDIPVTELTIDVAVTNDGEKTTVTYDKGEVVVPEDKNFEIKKFEVGTNAPDQALVTFEINQTIDLALASQDNIKIEAINPTTGKVMTSKNKTWNGYLNDAQGNKYGMGSTLKPGVYTTVFSAEQLEHINPSDVVIKLTAIQDGVEYTAKKGETEIKEVEPVQVTDLKVEALENGDAIFGFNIDQTINLKLNTNDNIIIRAVEKETGDVLSTKNKTWSNYLNDAEGAQFGRDEVVKSGRYLTKFSKDQLRGKAIEDIAIEIVVIQENVETKVTTEFYNMVQPVKIENVAVAPNGEGVHVAFDIDQDLSLKLNSEDNVTVEAIDKATGEVLKKKDKTWTDYLNNEAGEQFGLNELVVAGKYATTFNKDQLGGKTIDEVEFRITTVQEGIKTSVTTGEFKELQGAKIEELKAAQSEDKSIVVDFTIDQEINLGFASKENLTIDLINKVTGESVASKGKLQKAYLVDEEGNTYGLGDTIPAGKYSVVFSKEEVGEFNIDDLQIIVTTTKNGIDISEATDKVGMDGELPTPVLDNVFGGSNRYETSVDVSVNGWEKSDSVVLVSGNAIVDGISAAPLAGAKDAPILLTEQGKIPTSVKAEIERLGAKNIYLIGGNTVISQDVEKELSDMELKVERIGGLTRYETSLNIAKEVAKEKEIDKAFIVGGNGEADGLSIGAVAAKDGEEAPIILVENDKITEETKTWLDENITSMDIIGGETVLSKNVEEQLSAMVEADKVTRIAGARREETNAKIIETYYDKYESVIVVKGDNQGMIDGLTSGPLAAKYNAPLVMVLDSLNEKQEEVLSKNGEAQVYQVGEGVVKSVVDKITELLSKK
ncbi:cell wall-binding repeat-containing protein [Romboutsia sp.]|uniref:cell wall-binding repeat-containing protein n=1 Tax=Romboutsia sp. TaxID=1965302 RepID=UPI003F2D1785